MPPPDKLTATSTQIFQAAPKVTQSIVRDLLTAERNVMHMKRREDIHQNLVQIVKKHVTKPSVS